MKIFVFNTLLDNAYPGADAVGFIELVVADSIEFARILLKAQLIKQFASYSEEKDGPRLDADILKMGYREFIFLLEPE